MCNIYICIWAQINDPLGLGKLRWHLDVRKVKVESMQDIEAVEKFKALPLIFRIILFFGAYEGKLLVEKVSNG